MAVESALDVVVVKVVLAIVTDAVVLGENRRHGGM